ncbi:hypothetical protein scyTo_0011492 [Scyliorhinus torazame]|uniref:Uncharacterized protein n=1 Tax=Scyliorhinus torazame TaxID=75743 RepID=A0A401NP33_SCYTO|nr:hypothetical protein [Scyliorhinus torazame]
MGGWRAGEAGPEWGAGWAELQPSLASGGKRLSVFHSSTLPPDPEREEYTEKLDVRLSCVRPTGCCCPIDQPVVRIQV